MTQEVSKKEAQTLMKSSNNNVVIQILATVLDSNDIIYVISVDELYIKKEQSNVYQLLQGRELNDVIKEAMAPFDVVLPTNGFTEIINQLKIHAPAIPEINDDCIMVSPHLFWDKIRGQLVDQPTSSVFYRLFDTKTESKDIIKMRSFTKEEEKALLQRYESTIKELDNGIEEERYEFLRTWANKSHDVYMDLQRAHAYMFLKKKPLGSYILIGIRRNGKSTYVKLTHNIWGTNNTSNVQLTQLGDPHYTHMLRSTRMNAPDEEEDKALNAQAFYKTLADHGDLSLPVMRSNVPVNLTCDFMCFFPMNHIPEWKGAGAAACMSRSLIIPFDADLSKFDKSQDNFMATIFNPETMADYMGSVFAYAYYYHRNNFDFSPTMLSYRENMEKNIDSCMTYYKHFTRYFDGYEKQAVVYQDYQYWCQANDVKINARRDFAMVFRVMANSRSTYTTKEKNRIRVYRVTKPGHVPLLNNARCVEVGKLKRLHEVGLSIVDQLDHYYEEKGWDGPINVNGSERLRWLA